MAKTVGCSDFNHECSFRITADEGQESSMVDAATAHAMTYHPEFANGESMFREGIQSKITNLMAQAHMSPEEIAEATH